MGFGTWNVLRAARWLIPSVVSTAMFAGCWGATERDTAGKHDPCAVVEGSQVCCSHVECAWLGAQSGVGPGCVTPNQCTKHADCSPAKTCVTRWYRGFGQCGQFSYSGFEVRFCADFCPVDGIEVNGTCVQKWSG